MDSRLLPASTVRLNDLRSNLDIIIGRIADPRVEHQALIVVDEDLKPLAAIVDYEVYAAFAQLLARLDR